MDTHRNSCIPGNGAKDDKDHRAGETILIAEDDILTSSSMKKILEYAGYRVLVAMDGEEALTIFRERHGEISVIISDVIMPGRNGVEFLNEVRMVNPGMKVLFVSGYTANFLSEMGIPVEGMQFLTKPYAKQELVRRVRELLAST